LNSNRCFKRLL